MRRKSECRTSGVRSGPAARTVAPNGDCCGVMEEVVLFLPVKYFVVVFCFVSKSRGDFESGHSCLNLEAGVRLDADPSRSLRLAAASFCLCFKIRSFKLLIVDFILRGVAQKNEVEIKNQKPSFLNF